MIGSKLDFDIHSSFPAKRPAKPFWCGVPEKASEVPVRFPLHKIFWGSMSV